MVCRTWDWRRFGILCGLVKVHKRSKGSCNPDLEICWWLVGRSGSGEIRKLGSFFRIGTFRAAQRHLTENATTGGRPMPEVELKVEVI